MARISTLINEFFIMIRALYNKWYPEFVLKNKDLTQIPVFIFHSVDPVEFEEQLMHLKLNKYKTLDCNEFEKALENKKYSLIEKAVVLTFDDGMDNLYKIVYPLLKSYGFKAVAFIIPNWIGKNKMITWEQVKEMHQSNIIDFQSHSLNHMAIYTSPEIVDFFHPNYTKLPLWNLLLLEKAPVDHWDESSCWGAPIYEHVSRLSDSKRYYPDENIRKLCNSVVKENGSEDFFKRMVWRRRLKSVIMEYKRKNSIKNRYESDKEQKETIRDEIKLSRQIIEKYLPNKKIRHFAYPWNESGKLVESLLIECGYVTAFGSLLENPKINGRSIDRYYIRRISGDFIRRLPGEGRKSFVNILFNKMLRRIITGTKY